MHWTSREEMIEEIDIWVRDLCDVDDGSVILVEGKKDVQSLRSMGIDSDIRELNLGHSIIDLLEHIKMGTGPFEGGQKASRLIILTDWDRKGGKLASSVAQYCRSVDLDHDLEYRRRIAMILGRWIRDVESIASIYSNIVDGSIKL